jgi:hypothetical protein
MIALNIRGILPVMLIGMGTAFASCWGISGKDNLQPPQDDIIRDEAYVPVYGTDPVTHGIAAMPPQPIEQSGKIYVWGNLLFQIENLQGIHVIDYTDRQHPVKLGFIKVKGCSELAIKGYALITNNMNDLVTIDISKPGEAKELGRVPNAFPFYSANAYMTARPPEKGKYYVCVDFYRGDVVGWKLEKNVKGAYCFNN